MIEHDRNSTMKAVKCGIGSKLPNFDIYAQNFRMKIDRNLMV